MYSIMYMAQGLPELLNCPALPTPQRCRKGWELQGWAVALATKPIVHRGAREDCYECWFSLYVCMEGFGPFHSTHEGVARGVVRHKNPVFTPKTFWSEKKNVRTHSRKDIRTQ